MPGRYHDAIYVFQHLIDGFKDTKNNTTGNLVFVIDLLDEAAVAYSSLHISELFYKYNDEWEFEKDEMSGNIIR